MAENVRSGLLRAGVLEGVFSTLAENFKLLDAAIVLVVPGVLEKTGSFEGDA